jgi:hypothetical protein
MYKSAMRLCSAMAVVALLTACASSTGNPSAPPGTTLPKSTVPSVAPDPQTTTQSNASRLLPGDTVLCNATAGIPGAGGFSGTITISRWVSVDVAPEDIYSLSLDTAFAGWTGSGPGCGPPTTWSPDFTKKLVSGVPPGESSSHIAVVDLATGIIQDLTAPRQKTGFGDPVLNETDPIFLSDPPTDKVRFGGNVVAFKSNSDALSSVSLNSPTTVKPVSSSRTIGQVVLPGHPEYQLNYTDGPYNRVSPDGSLFVPFESSIGITPAAHIDQPKEVSCANVQPGINEDILGWPDSRHLVIRGQSATDPGSTVVDLVTVESRLECRSLIPPTAKQISRAEMLPDRSAIIFTADGPNGPQDYSVPTTGAASQPTPGNYPQMSAETVIYQPGNY